MDKELLERMCDGMVDILYGTNTDDINELDREDQIEVCRMTARLIHLNSDMEYEDIIKIMNENHEVVKEALERASDQVCIWCCDDEYEVIKESECEMEEEAELEEEEEMLQEEERKDWAEWADVENE